jgi:hypothetical protein
MCRFSGPRTISRPLPDGAVLFDATPPPSPPRGASLTLGRCFSRANPDTQEEFP